MMLLPSIVSALMAGVALGKDRQVLSFTRSVDACGDQDMAIPTAVSRTIWATGASQPRNPEYPPYHDKRGGASIGFRGRTNVGPRDESLDYFDIKMDKVHISETAMNDPEEANRTSYVCKSFELPKRLLDGKRRHAIRADPILDPGSSTKVHHMFIYICNSADDEHLGWEGHCPGANMPDTLRGCHGIAPTLATWTVGGEAMEFDHGFPVGKDGTDSASYRYILEVHYDNYDRKPFVDSSGIRLSVTEDLTPVEAGMFLVLAIGGMYVPKGVRKTIHARCPGSLLTEEAIGKDGIWIDWTMMHMHSWGVSQWANVVDGKTGKVKARVGNEMYYDFDMQQYFRLDKPVQVLPGDHIDTFCDYDNIDGTFDVLGGDGTDEEMCAAFLMYYPRRDIAVCFFQNWPKDTEYDPMVMMTQPDAVRIYQEEEREAAGSVTMATLSVPGLGEDASGLALDFSMDYEDLPDAQCEAITPPAGVDAAPSSHGFGSVAELEQFLESHDHMEPLDDDVAVYWNYNKAANTIDFTVDANTNGWAGLGFSPTGNMMGADIVLGWVKPNGETVMHDRFSAVHSTPVIDDVQSIWNRKGTRVLADGTIAGDSAAGGREVEQPYRTVVDNLYQAHDPLSRAEAALGVVATASTSGYLLPAVAGLAFAAVVVASVEARRRRKYGGGDDATEAAELLA